MLNYVGALVINYLIFDSQSYWRDTSSPTAKVFPQGKNLPDAASWPAAHVGSLVLPFGLLLGDRRRRWSCWLLYTRTRFGFEVQVIGDSPRAAAYAGHAHAAEDPRRDGAVGRGRRHRRRHRRTATSATRSTRAGSRPPGTATPGS